MVLRIFTLLFVILISTEAMAKETYTLKFATLFPTGTAWSKILDNWIKDIETESKGRLKIKMYPGGVMGDEPDVLRKIRKNQLQGALFTGYGIGRIFSPARVLEMPFLFKNTDESDYVRDRLMPDIEKGFRKNGFELLGWPEIGFINFFSKKKIGSIEDMKKRRVWLWQGDPLGEAMFKSADMSPIPLSIIDVYSQLSAKHGSIDTVYISTFGAIAMQWYTKVKYASNISVTNAIGGLVVSNRFYNQLPDDLKLLLKSRGKSISDKIRDNARQENITSKALLKQNGIIFMWDWNDRELEEFLAMRDKAAKHLEQTNYIPKAFFDKTRTLLDQYRNSQKKTVKQ